MSISWGFPHGIVEIEKALIKAHDQNIVILAAASNEGYLNEIAFPARLSDSVICIGAATGHGSIADFTTSDPKFQHYATLGIAVRGASLNGMWYQQNPTELRSGTSTATPIAAGIAALLIDYAGRNACKLTKGHEGMLKLFAMLSRHDDTYRVLALQPLMDPNAMKGIIEEALANGILRYELL
jgi:Subtilase family